MVGAVVELIGAGVLLAPQAEVEIVENFEGREPHFDVESFHLVAEVVVEPQGGDGDEQTKCSSHQRIRDSPNDGGITGPPRRAAAPERVKDADDRAEQADERSGGSDGG